MRKSLPILFGLFISITQSIAQQGKPQPIKPDSAGLAETLMFLQSQEHIPKAPSAIQSPNAAGLGAYGEIPVSLYTGKPEIDVNLHAVSSGPVSIPISLSYDATGVRPDMHPGWVGLNFNLSTNYSITRTIRDEADDNKPNASTLGEHGYAFHTALLNGDWTSNTEIKSIANTTLNQILIDTEPDEFSFNAPGLSGKFYLGSDGKWKVQCDRPVRVQLINSVAAPIYPLFTPPSFTGNQWDAFNNHQYAEHYEGFTITDDQGTKYVFGGSNNAYMEYSTDFFNQGKANWVCNAWYLKSVTRHTGQIINFTYERGDFVAQMYFSIYNKSARTNSGGAGFTSYFTCSGWSSLIGTLGPYVGKLISPIYLKEITADNFKVKFTSTVSTELPYSEDIFSTYLDGLQTITPGFTKRDYLTFLYDCYYPVNTGVNSCGAPSLSSLIAKLKWRKLDKIEIQNGSGTTVKEFGFTYNNDITKRLMLEKVQEKSGTSVIPPYEFTYFTDGTMPDYGKSHTDHWGYNNGKIINVNTDFSAIDTYGLNYRDPATDPKILKLLSITSLKYPTGGVTKFILEPHAYGKEVKLKRWEGLDNLAANKRAGGLRIKEIHSYDNVTGPVVSKKYYYLSSFNATSPDTSAAVLSSGVLGGKAQYYWPDYKPLPEDANIVVEEDIFSTQSVLPASQNSMGSHIGYSQVVERSSTEGWVLHQFTNFDNGYLDGAPSGFLQPSATPYQPYNSTAFQRGKLNSQKRYFQNGNLASETTYFYNLVGAVSDYSARSVKTIYHYLCQSNNKVYEGTATLIDARKFLVTQVADYTYDQHNGAVSANVKDNTYWPNGQLNINGQNDSKGRNIKTWFKYPPNFNDATSQAMTTANIIAPALEVFNYMGTEAAPNSIKLQTVTYVLSSGFYLPKKVETKLGANGVTNIDIEFLTYDARGNLLTFKEKNGLTTKLEYYQTSDVGKVDLLKQRTLADGASRAQATAYDYKPLVGVQSIADPNAKTITYDYDEFSRLSAVKNPNGNARASYCYNYAGQLTPCTALAPTGSIAASGLVLIGTGGALPVTLVEFEATKAEKAVLLSWSTTTETNSESFDIERSKDGKQWSKLGSVAARGESSELTSYTFADNKPWAAENLYRLKMIDRDGTFAYSRIRSVTFNKTGVALYPNPVTIGEKLTLFTDDLDKITSIKIFDSSGRMVDQSKPSREISTAKLAPGLYIVQITYTDGSLSTHRVVKQ